MLEAADYLSWIKSPQQLRESGAAFVLNPMAANHGHVAMAKNFTQLLGFPEMQMSGLDAARKLQARSTPFVYLTLTNDHQRLTEKGHDQTLKWERSAESRSAAATFIGPSGKFVFEGPRKAIFCQMSEGLVNRTGDPWHRFTPPCMTQDKSRRPGEEYASLIHTAPPLVRTSGFEQEATRPRWLTRKVATKAVAAAGQFMYPLSHEKALKSDLSYLHFHSLLLLRYLDPPLLQRGLHLGVPVQTRVEVRIFGMVQWEPLRIWTSRYGFFRGGTPWLNYSSQVEFNEHNSAMWNINRGVEAKCEGSPPNRPPPWRNAAAYNDCKARSGLPPKSNGSCCICLTVADVFDTEHDEMGFATSGTLRRLDHVATAAGLQPRRLWQGVDEALIREFIVEQRRYQEEAKGAPLSRWSTLFSADVGFAADGRAYMYENLLMPNWKRPGYFWHEAVDRGSAIGIYSGQALAMADVLLKSEADAFHRQLLSSIKDLDGASERKLLAFLRTQGLASALGFRRTWPTPTRAPSHSFDGLAEASDVEFSRLLNKHKLLLPSMDVLSSERSRTDAWGGPTAKVSELTVPKWPIGDGILFSKPSGRGRGNVCMDSTDIVNAYDAQAADRGAT